MATNALFWLKTKYKRIKMSETIQYEVKNAVGYIRLNRPKSFNSFNREMSDAFQKALKKAIEDKTVRAVMITGNGKAFCAGQDLKEVLDRENNPGFEKILEEGYNPIIKLIRSLQKPVVAAVNGVAAGAGANIALACDICVAVEEAAFIQAFSKIGLVPDSGGTYFLPRLIGFQKASALMMLGDKVDAKEAERIGMIFDYFPAEEFEQKAIALTEKLAQMPTQALAQTKELLNRTYQNTLSQQLDFEGSHQIKAAKSYDYNEGVQAFVEKRKPKFEGR